MNNYPSLPLLLGHTAIYASSKAKTSKVWGSDLHGTSNEYMTWDSMVWDDATSLG